MDIYHPHFCLDFEAYKQLGFLSWQSHTSLDFILLHFPMKAINSSLWLSSRLLFSTIVKAENKCQQILSSISFQLSKYFLQNCSLVGIWTAFQVINHKNFANWIVSAKKEL